MPKEKQPITDTQSLLDFAPRKAKKEPFSVNIDSNIKSDIRDACRELDCYKSEFVERAIRYFILELKKNKTL